MVQPNWNIEGHNMNHHNNGELRQTQFVPTYEDNKDEDDSFFKVQYDRDNSPFNANKMRTIKEEDEGKFSGSDTGYFSNEEDFNNRDHDEDAAEEEYNKRR